MKKNAHDNPDKTLALAVSVEGQHEIDEKILEYMESCLDGSYKCKVCGKISGKSLKQNQKQNLKNHIETYMEGLSYACPICNKSFRSRNSLSNHRSVYHKTVFRFRNSLSKHKYVNHK